MPFAIATANCKLSKWKSPPHRAIDNTPHFNSYQHRSRPITLNCSIHSLITIQTHKMTKSEAFTTQPNPHRDNNYIIIVSLRTTTLLHDAFWSSHDDTNFDKGQVDPMKFHKDPCHYYVFIEPMARHRKFMTQHAMLVPRPVTFLSRLHYICQTTKMSKMDQPLVNAYIRPTIQLSREFEKHCGGLDTPTPSQAARFASRQLKPLLKSTAHPY